MAVVSSSRSGRLAAAGLALAAGFADAYNYFHWHAFAANMTGNTVIFAISLYQGPRPALLPLTLIACFVAGSFIGRLVVDRFPVVAALLIEALVLAAAAFAGTHGYAPVAFAMGIQSIAITSFAGVAANTSFISGDYSRLGAALGDLVNPRTRREETWRNISVFVPLLLAYAAGALLAAYCKTLPYEILLVVPIVLTVACIKVDPAP